MKRMILCVLLFLGYTTAVTAQDAAVKRTPEELKELFGYCAKTDLMEKYKFTAEMADKVGEIDYWARLQQQSIDANTNETYATAGELQTEVIKRYKAIHLSDEQLKGLLDIEKNKGTCPATELVFNKKFDTLSTARALQLYKTLHRKPLIDKLGINGRQADMLFEIEVWKEKEAFDISKIPETDFNRIRRTVAMSHERDRRFKVVGLSDEQIAKAVAFFNEKQL